MKRTFTLFTAIFVIAMSGKAQNTTYANQVIVVNGGSYSNPDDFVEVAAYNLSTEDYQVFDEIKTQSVQDVIIDGKYAFVAAQDSLVKYDLDTYQRTAAIELSALKKLAVYENKLIVTRQYPATEDFIYILEKEDLSEIIRINTSGETSGLVVVGDTAYVAVPGAWGTVEGKLAIVDLVNEIVVKEINFGSIAMGLKDVMVENSIVYTVNSHFSDYINNVYSISKYNIASGDTSTTVYTGDYYGFYGSSILTNGQILFPLSMNIAAYNIADETVNTFTTMNPSAMIYNIVDNQVYVTESNYTDWGKLHTFSMDGNVIGGELAIGIAPEGIAIDYRTESGVKDYSTTQEVAIQFYPNPCSENLFIKLPENHNLHFVQFFDYSGRMVKEVATFKNEINLSDLPKGSYIIRFIADREIFTRKLIKN